MHTGVVIDARGLAIQPALFPKIMDERGQTLYAPESVDREAAVQQGYVAYAKAFDQAPAQARVGEHPLVLRALRVAGDPRRFGSQRRGGYPHSRLCGDTATGTTVSCFNRHVTHDRTPARRPGERVVCDRGG